jgi:hypothetical protein
MIPACSYNRTGLFNFNTDNTSTGNISRQMEILGNCCFRFDIYFYYFYNKKNFAWKEILTMKLCFCRFLFAVAIILIALIWWPAAWAKIVIIIAAAILALASLFYQTCCCRMKGTKPAAVSPPSTPPQEEPPKEEG